MTAGGRIFHTLDNQSTLDAALADPVGFIRGMNRVIIDEVQRAPRLLLAVKESIDDDYRPGRFLLTGSANVLALPGIADSLAGRIETLMMLPLAQVELAGKKSKFLNRLFDVKLTATLWLLSYCSHYSCEQSFCSG